MESLNEFKSKQISSESDLNRIESTKRISFKEEIKFQIRETLKKALLFRPELIISIKCFLPDTILIENIPQFYQNNVFHLCLILA